MEQMGEGMQAYVLRNLRDIWERERLAKFEMDVTSQRLVESAVQPVAGRLEAIHHYIFQDGYDWAGKFRTLNIARAG